MWRGRWAARSAGGRALGSNASSIPKPLLDRVRAPIAVVLGLCAPRVSGRRGPDPNTGDSPSSPSRGPVRRAGDEGHHGPNDARRAASAMVRYGQAVTVRTSVQAAWTVATASRREGSASEIDRSSPILSTA